MQGGATDEQLGAAQSVHGTQEANCRAPLSPAQGGANVRSKCQAFVLRKMPKIHVVIAGNR